MLLEFVLLPGPKIFAKFGRNRQILRDSLRDVTTLAKVMDANYSRLAVLIGVYGGNKRSLKICSDVHNWRWVSYG